MHPSNIDDSVSVAGGSPGDWNGRADRLRGQPCERPGSPHRPLPAPHPEQGEGSRAAALGAGKSRLLMNGSNFGGEWDGSCVPTGRRSRQGR